MKINLADSPLTNVLALVNAKNSSNITETQVTVDAVIASTENPGDNTKVTLTGIDGQGIEGSRSFFYGRVDVSSQISPLPASVAVLETDDSLQVDIKVSTALGLDPDETITSNLVMPTSGVPGSVDIKGINGSLLYTDTPLTVVLDLA